MHAHTTHAHKRIFKNTHVQYTHTFALLPGADNVQPMGAVQALLRAGADVSSTLSNGWSALAGQKRPPPPPGRWGNKP